MLIDQQLLGPKNWDYAFESWIHTANNNPTTHSISPMEAVTNIAPDIATTFQFTFGCPVILTQDEKRSWKFEAS